MIDYLEQICNGIEGEQVIAKVVRLSHIGLWSLGPLTSASIPHECRFMLNVDVVRVDASSITVVEVEDKGASVGCCLGWNGCCRGRADGC